ncbi:hypothetical protein SCP_0108310 [Sparassis crispa]|uniref:Uncharacterized protein n=1 Tax=Sparassis crispa TaxID=139825 RepID=A0A401G721_9APHY|nr:hypothetical protein SCP_0108310 [Sparassis crispa]GBE77949.1 hypothetical protein SCP_0108310 [Sparassis crispa]
MLSVAPQPVHLPLHVDNHQPKDVELNELGDLADALEPFAKMIKQSTRSVRLHCTVPTLAASNTCFDLHDLHDLRARSLLFVHNLVETLRVSGIPASYRLQLTSCPLCLVCALPPDLDSTKIKAAALSAVRDAHLQLKDKAFLADLEDGLALVIT